MSEYVPVFATCRLVAFALVCGIVTAVLDGSSPVFGGSARDGPAVVSGQVRVIDGDTIEVNAIRIRLEGIDAPETGQTCGRKWLGSWDCGAEATRFLDRLTEHSEVRCLNRGLDKYGRMLGICFVGDVDINAEMVRQGLAWAFLKYSRTYVEVEVEARTMRLGIWEGEATPAWIYRAQRWNAADDTAPGGCAIKGNISRVGHVYHMPWSPWYGKVKVDSAKGERWFCSEDEALAAGWRPAYVR